MNHLLFYVKENQISPTYSSLIFFIFLSLQFLKKKKKNQLLFLRDWEVHKIEIWSTHLYTWIRLLVFIPFISSIFFQIPKH